MRFYIKTIAGTTIVVRDIEGSETILELKRRIYEQAEIPIELQRLIFAGKILENHRTLCDYNVESECTFHVIIVATRANILNEYVDKSQQIETSANPVELQYNLAPSPAKVRGKSRLDSYLARCSSYKELYLLYWGDANCSDQRPPALRSARALKYQTIITDIIQNKRLLTFEPPPKGAMFFDALRLGLLIYLNDSSGKRLQEKLYMKCYQNMASMRQTLSLLKVPKYST
jgi:hypothetical protein